MAIPDLPEIKTDINKRSKKDQIQLFGTKKKTSADKVLEELRNANVPAILIKLPNEQVGVFNLATNKYEYKGDIETESTTVRSNVEDLKDFAFIKNLEQTDTSQKLQTSDDADETYMTLDFDVISTEDIFGKGTRYEPDIYDDRVMRLARQEQMTDLDVMSVDAFGDYRSADYVPSTDFPRRSTFEELNPNLRGANPDDPLITRIGDRLQKLYSLETIRGQSPVSGSIVATGQPVLSGTMALSMGLGMSEIFSGVGNQFLGMQEDQAMKAAEGVPGYTAFTAIDLGTGRPVDITAKPGVGGTVTTNLDVQGPLALDGKVFYSPLEAARYAAANGLVSEYSLRMYGDIDYLMEDQARKNLAKQQVQVDPTRGMGDYNPDDGSVSLGAGLKGDVTGIALADDGTLALKTGAGGFIMSGGEMAKVSQGIGFSGLRGGIGTKSLSELSSAEAKGLLERIESGEITSTPKTTAALQTFVGEDIVPDFIPDYTYGDYTVPNIPRSPITEIGFTDVTGSMAGRFQEGESGVIYGDGDRFSETLDTDVYSEGFTEEISFDPPASQPPDPFFDQSDVGITTPEPVFAPDPFYDESDGGFDDSQDSGSADPGSMGDTGFGGGGGFATAEGGRIGKQEGGTTVKPVSQIVQGAGFIAPQQNATDQQTIADDIPMEAEEGDFIINAPAAEFAGRQDIVDMILEAINSLKEKGVDIQYGNPKIPIKSRVQLAVSRNEVYIPKVIAEEIGYDKLEKINNRGKREVERRQKESQKQVNRGGFISKANGGDVEDKSSLLLGTDDSNFLQDLGRAVIDQLGDKIKGFLSRKEEMPVPTPRPKSISPKQKEQDDLKGLEKRPFVKKDEPKYTNFRDLITQRKFNLNLPKDREDAYDLLNLLEVNPKVDPRKGNVPTDTSGFTVGIGFDLGKHDANDLKNFNFSDSLYNKLLPFVSKIGKQVQTDPNFMLTDEELDEVNTVVLNKKYNEFEKAFPIYKNIDPLDKAVMYSAYYLGALTREKNPYTTFMKIYKDTDNITRALKEGIVDKINNPKNYESERATKALNWLASKMPKPKRRPERIQDKPDIRSFLSPQLSA